MSHLYDGRAEHGDVSIVKLVLNLLRGQIVVCDLDLLGCNVNILKILAFRIRFAETYPKLLLIFP